MSSPVALRLAKAPPQTQAIRIRGAEVWSTTAAIVWGVAAFGAVYEWGSVVLGLLVASAAISMVRSCRVRNRSTVLLAAAIVLPVVVQLAPLAGRAVHPLAHATFYAEQLEAGPHTWERISVAPAATLRAAVAVTLLGCFAVALIAYLRANPQGVRKIVRNVAVTAALVATIALVQSGTFNGKIYWFWEAEWRNSHNYFGPFVNRNHFAGWMILAAALTTGSLAAQVAVAAITMKPGWRHRVLWLSTREANTLLLTSAALLTMFLSLVWTMSRSGIAGGSIALLIVLGAAATRMKGVRKMAGPMLVAIVIAAALGWRGAERLAAWYGTTDTLAWRMQLWQDSLPMLQDFWLLGSGLNTYGTLTWVYPITRPVPHAYTAHNDYLQLAIEGGLLVGIPALVAICVAVRTTIQRLRAAQDEGTWWLRLGAAAGLCGIAVQEVTDFSLQIPGVATLFAVALAIAVHEAPISKTRSVHAGPASSGAHHGRRRAGILEHV